MKSLSNLPTRGPLINAYKGSPLNIRLEFPVGYAIPTVTAEAWKEDQRVASAVITEEPEARLIGFTEVKTRQLSRFDDLSILFFLDGIAKLSCPLYISLESLPRPQDTAIRIVLDEYLTLSVQINDIERVQQVIDAAQQVETRREEIGIIQDDLVTRQTDVTAKQQTVADDAQAVDIAAQQVEQSRAQVAVDKQVVTDAKAEMLAAYGSTQALTDAVTQAGASRDQAATIVTAIQQGIPKGPWNASTNSPALTATPNVAFADGSYYPVTVAGVTTFAGMNFAVGQAMAVGDSLWKIGTQWFRLPFAIGTRSVGRTQLANRAVSHKQMNMFTPGKNLFNIGDDENVLNFYIDIATGNIIANNTQNTSHYIPVTAGLPYILTSNTGNGGRFNWYDANLTWLSGNQSGLTYFVAPANAAYLRVSIFTGSVEWATVQVAQATVKTTFEAYNLTLTSSSEVPIKVTNATNADVAALANALHQLAVLSSTNLGYTRGANYFNINDSGVVLGSYINYTTGLPVANASYNATGFIPVTGGQTYTASYKHQMAWYDANKVYISGSNSSDTNKTQVAPANAAFARCTVAVGSWSVYTFTVGSVQLPYEEYKLEIDTIGGVKIYAKNVVPATETPPVIAPKIYIPRGKEIRIYSENLHRYYEAEGRGRTEVTLPGGTIGGRSAYIVPSNLTTIAASVKAKTKDFELASTTNFTVQPVDETLNTPRNVMNIGDSYTLRETFTNALIASAAGSGIAFQGMRLSTAATVQCRHEGRGGWSMVHYHATRTDLFTPFWQPQDPYRYFGNTGYWITAISNPTDYDAGYVDPAIRALFNGGTGLLIAPAVNDVQYFNSDSTYKRWDGSAWVTVAGLVFSFNFAKYRTLFGCPVIDIVQILLGTNDFSATVPSGFASVYSAFKTRYDTTIASLKADNPAIKIIVGVPVSSGRQGRDGFDLSERRKAAYWLLAKNLYADFGGREGENIFLADYHSTVDRLYGYAPAQVVPFSQYTGVERELYTTDTVHLGADGFKQMGDLYFGAIQAAR